MFVHRSTALLRVWVGGFRKRMAALLLVLALIGGGTTVWATAVTQSVIAYGSVAAAALGVISARPRQIGAARTAKDGTVWQDFDNGETLITHPTGSWSVTKSRPR